MDPKEHEGHDSRVVRMRWMSKSDLNLNFRVIVYLYVPPRTQQASNYVNMKIILKHHNDKCGEDLHTVHSSTVTCVHIVRRSSKHRKQNDFSTTNRNPEAREATNHLTEQEAAVCNMVVESCKTDTD